MLSQPANIPSIVQSTRTQLTNNVGGVHAAEMEICVTETGAGTNTGVVVSLFAADNYLTWLENGAANVDYQILHNDLLTSSQQPGHAYYGAMMAHLLANLGDNLVAATSDCGTLHVHAASRADGKAGVMLLNTDPAQTNIVTVNFSGINLASSGTAYQFGLTNFVSINDTPSFPVGTNSLSGLGNQFTVFVPPYTMIDLLIPEQADSPPALAAISNYTVNVGQTVAFTASAIDTNLPTQTLTFELLAGATNAALTQIDNSNANFLFRPLVAQANSTNNFALRVSDGGSPPLSATQNFCVIVNPLATTTISAVSFSDGVFNFDVNGQTGPDYEIQTSSNLTQWCVGFITNSPVLPFHWTDTNATFSRRFYRVMLGPPLP